MIRCFVIALCLRSPLFGAIRTAAERELTQRRLDSAVSAQRDGRIASDGFSFLTLWRDEQDSSGDILAARLGPDGVLIDEVPLVVANSAERERGPALAWGADRYLAVWQRTSTASRDVSSRSPATSARSSTAACVWRSTAAYFAWPGSRARSRGRQSSIAAAACSRRSR